MKIGNFVVDFFAVNHSIPGARRRVLPQSPAGNVLHTGDFKLDQSPIDGVRTDFGALARFVENGRRPHDERTRRMPRTRTSRLPRLKWARSVAVPLLRTPRVVSLSRAFASHIHRLQQICRCGCRVRPQSRGHGPFDDSKHRYRTSLGLSEDLRTSTLSTPMT